MPQHNVNGKVMAGDEVLSWRATGYIMLPYIVPHHTLLIASGVCAEWRTAVVVDYAQRALETQCQLMVSVRSANSGGLIVRGHYFKGDDPALSLAKQIIGAQ